MKLIALRDFRNVQSLGLKDDAGNSKIDRASHPDHVHKGAMFEIGAGDGPLDAEGILKLAKSNAAAAQALASLVVAGCVGDGTNARLVADVKAEVAAESKRDEAVRESAKIAAGHAIKVLREQVK